MEKTNLQGMKLYWKGKSKADNVFWSTPENAAKRGLIPYEYPKEDLERKKRVHFAASHESIHFTPHHTTYNKEGANECNPS
jgi:hypothetical protein